MKIPQDSESVSAAVDFGAGNPIAWLRLMSVKQDLKTQKIDLDNFPSGQTFLTQVGQLEAISDPMGLALTKDEAILKATQLIEEMGIDQFEVDKVGLSYTTPGIFAPGVGEKKYYYTVLISRNIAGTRVAQVSQKAVCDNELGMDTKVDFRAAWNSERIMAVFDDSGLRYFEYVNPVIEESREEAQSLLSIPEMKERTIEQLKISYGDSRNKNTKIYITGVEMAYQFIPIKDDMENYWIKPCWIVWGYLDQFDQVYAPANQALIVIDATDGSIVR